MLALGKELGGLLSYLYCIYSLPCDQENIFVYALFHQNWLEKHCVYNIGYMDRLLKDRHSSNGWEEGGRDVVGVCAGKREVSQNKEDR